MQNFFYSLAGISTLLQAIFQLVFCSICVAQYYCYVDFLHPNMTSESLLIFIRLMYLHNPEFCGQSINIGQVVPDLPNQTTVFIKNIPASASRVFVLNSLGAALSSLSFLTSILYLWTLSKHDKPIKWPWVLSTIFSSIIDITAVILFANDAVYTTTLSDLVEYIGGRLIGAGNASVKTNWTAWTMAFLYSRFIVFLIINILMLIVVIMGYHGQTPALESVRVDRPTQTETIEMEDLNDNITQNNEIPRIPRARFNRFISNMRGLLRSPLNWGSRNTVNNDSRSSSSVLAVTKAYTQEKQNNRNKVTFPDNLLSRSQRLESNLAEQSTDTTTVNLRRRSTVVELQGQMPWTYVMDSAGRAEQPDEDIPPPVPTPDYPVNNNTGCSCEASTAF